MDIDNQKQPCSVDGFGQVPIQALSMATRGLLSQFLNPEQVLMSRKGLPRDHRGLADLMGLSYAEMKNYQRSTDPMAALLELIESLPRADIDQPANGSRQQPYRWTFQNIIEWLEQIERFDVADDIQQSLSQDRQTFLERTKSIDTTVALNSQNISELEKRALTFQDIVSQGPTFYHAFICYVQTDWAFVERMIEFLRSKGISLLVPDRDVLVGQNQQDTIMTLIEERCRRMIVVLSPEFLQSDECAFQTRFALSLAIEQRSRKLIPVITKACTLPTPIRLLTKIDLSNDKCSCWSWDKLWASVKDSETPALQNSTSGAANSKTMFISNSKNQAFVLPAASGAAVRSCCSRQNFGESSTDKEPSAKKALAAAAQPLLALPANPGPSRNYNSNQESLSNEQPPAYSDLNLDSVVFPVPPKEDPSSSTASLSQTASDSVKGSDSGISIKSGSDKKHRTSGWMQSIKKKITGSSNRRAAGAYAQLNS